MTEEIKNQKECDTENISIEESFKMLDTIVAQLEDRDISLEASFQAYEKGMKILKDCNQKIDTVEKKMMQINENGELSEF
ncbi:MAG: exodeoxyribonuclease VII small subunit [Lachnospiraceae bacterium]|jgi:exodeoxyribonuclease VII small subunit|nr:exodeoxyribonuclease VII small subunit [Lachnospiraceae bacterium]MDD3615158.1 exodeoxyribonuclease VII small subunit [Lachnospiraceae bacterium]